MLKGSCLCGAVAYQITGEPEKVLMCHCKKCRKASGAAFATNGIVKVENFSLVRGQDDFAEYESSPGVFRCFCRHCGSPLHSYRPGRDFVVVRLGTLDSPLQTPPSAHIYVESRADWDVIHDDLPQFDERP